MKKPSRPIVLIGLLMVSASLLLGEGQKRAGTSASPQLLIPLGARYLAMGGSALAITSGLEAIYWNPAGIDVSTNTAEAIFSYRSYIADMGVSFFAVSAKFSIGSVAFSLRSFDIGDIPVTTESAPDGTGEILSPTFFVAGLSYSNQLTERTSFGFTANMIHESFARVASTSLAFDAGVQYRDLLSVEKLSIGVSIKNVGPSMRYGGSGLFVSGESRGSERGETFYKVEAASFELPSTIELGAAYQFSLGERNDFYVTTTYQNNNFAYDEYRFGAEYSFDNTFFFRAGYLFSPSSDEQFPHTFQNFVFGAGLRLADVDGLHLCFDYAFVPVKWFDTNHVLALTVAF